jgi:hypothetical protein
MARLDAMALLKWPLFTFGGPCRSGTIIVKIFTAVIY